MANNTPIAGADAMINPYSSTYTGLPIPSQFNMSMSGYEPSQYFQVQPSDGGEYRFPTQEQHIGSSSIGLYHDPQAGTDSSGAGGYGLGMSVGDSGGVQGQGGGQEGERNPTVFWDRLIDGIVVGQGYDLTGGPTM